PEPVPINLSGLQLHDPGLVCWPAPPPRRIAPSCDTPLGNSVTPVFFRGFAVTRGFYGGFFP
ncbi:MAG TPA: hypothetical protein PLQ52_07975, partial [Lacunisphaera sp.]|nr:hypothetical protein [Lacunisphaera sp.]